MSVKHRNTSHMWCRLFLINTFQFLRPLPTDAVAYQLLTPTIVLHETIFGTTFMSADKKIYPGKKKN